jgi:hypothetical protein
LVTGATTSPSPAPSRPRARPSSWWNAAAFTLDCAAALDFGVTVSLAPGEGTKNQFVWARDAAGRVSEEGAPVAVVLDQIPPALVVNPTSGAYSDTIEIVASAGAQAKIHYAVLSDPTEVSPVINGSLAIFSGTTLKFRAYDFAGNASSIVTRNYTIDRDGPILGTVAVDTDTGYVNTLTVTLSLSAQGATWMGFAESPAALAAAGWTAYSTSGTYTLQSTSDGAKTVYAKFKDDAGNVIGLNGEIKSGVILDRTAPDERQIALLAPETPTGDFNKELRWTSTYTEDVTYEVQVHDDSAYASQVRPVSGGDPMITSETGLYVKPLLDAGTSTSGGFAPSTSRATARLGWSRASRRRSSFAASRARSSRAGLIRERRATAAGASSIRTASSGARSRSSATSTAAAGRTRVPRSPTAR